MPRNSIQTHLVLWVLLTTALLWLAGSVAIYRTVEHETHEIFDEALSENAHLMISFLTDIHFEQTKALHITEHLKGQHSIHVHLQVWNAQRQLVFYSQNTSNSPILPPSYNGQYAWINRGGDVFRAYAIWNDAHTLQVQIAEKRSVRELVVHEMLHHLALVLAVVIFLAWVGLYFIIKSNLKPLVALGHKLKNRNANQLQSIDIKNAPQEISPIINNLNHLLAQIQQKIEQEKRFTSNAAHELRTPLSAIRLNSQILQHSRNPQESQQAILDIQSGVDRAVRLMQQLLLLSTIERCAQSNSPTQAIQLDCFNANQMIKQVINELQFSAQKKSITVELITQHENCAIDANQEQFYILLRNLIENAIQYAPANSTVTVTTAQQNNTTHINVHDEGMGIDVHEQQKVFERFYRINGHLTAGNGLGLAIVKQIVDLHHAKIQMTQHQPLGFSVSLEFYDTNSTN